MKSTLKDILLKMNETSKLFVLPEPPNWLLARVVGRFLPFETGSSNICRERNWNVNPAVQIKTYGSWHWNLVTPANIWLLSWTGSGKTGIQVWVRCQRTLQQAQVFTGSSWGCTLVSIFKPWMKGKKIQASMSQKFDLKEKKQTLFGSFFGQSVVENANHRYIHTSSAVRLHDVPFKPFSKHQYN